MQPLKASAHCILRYTTEKGEKRKEAFNAQFRFMPPDKTFFRGDKFGEIRFGTNETDFWLRMKAELDSYWWGTKLQADQCRQSLLFNPGNIAEAIGMVNVTDDWKLFHRNGFDILDLYDGPSRIKRVYVNACDYYIERIEYFDELGLVKASVQLKDYATGESGVFCPTRIDVTYYNHGLEDSSLQIDLKHVAAFAPTDKQRNLLFQRPDRDGYEHVYRLDENCNFIEE